LRFYCQDGEVTILGTYPSSPLRSRD